MSWKLGSLFDGSGGFPLAGFLCDIEPRWASEVEPYPIAVTRSRFPNMKHLGDISKINGAELEPVDVITFGSPCQDLSVAGKRAGLKHEVNGDEETTRSGLFMEAVRIIKEMREATNGEYPRFALWENVPGAFSSNKGEDFKVVLEELIKIVEPTAVMPKVPKKGWAYADSYVGDGWSIAYRVFDAQYWGVPQRRRRIHLVLDLGGERAREVLFECEGLRGYFAEGRTPWESIAGDVEGGAGADDREGERVKQALGWPLGFRPENVRVYDEVATTLCNGTRPGFCNGVITAEPVVYESHPMDSRIKELTDDISPTVSVKWHKGAADTPLVAYSIENHPADSRVSIDESGKVQTLTSRMGTGGGNVPMVLESVTISSKQQSLATSDNLANTLGANDYKEPQAVVYCLQGNGIDRADTAGCNGKGWTEDTCYTLNTIDRPAVAFAMQGFGDYKDCGVASGLKARDYKDATDLVAEGQPIALDRVFFSQGQNALYDPQFYTDGTVPTLASAVAVRYIVRRLTPTECARLQGFADRWGEIDEKDDFTDEEYSFWLDVRNTHAEINGKAVKDYTKKQMLTWYNKLRTDSAEYKMWGNGIALPPALYCMQGIADALNKKMEEKNYGMDF